MYALNTADGTSVYPDTHSGAGEGRTMGDTHNPTALTLDGNGILWSVGNKVRHGDLCYIVYAALTLDGNGILCNYEEQGTSWQLMLYCLCGLNAGR